MANFRAVNTLGQRCFITSAITVVCVLATRMNSSVSPLMILGSPGSNDSSCSADARGEKERVVSFMYSCCIAWVGASPKLSCLKKLSEVWQSSLVECVEGGLHNGKSLAEHFTEHFCFSSLCICIPLSLKSLARDTNPSHFLHISV